MPKRADAIAQRLVLIACPGRIAIRLDQLQDLDAYRPFGGRPLHGRLIGIVHRRSRAANGLLEEGELQDRKSVVSGKSVSVRVDLGGSRIIKQKKKRRKKS